MEGNNGFEIDKNNIIQAVAFSSLVLLFLVGIVLLNTDLIKNISG